MLLLGGYGCHGKMVWHGMVDIDGGDDDGGGVVVWLMVWYGMVDGGVC